MVQRVPGTRWVHIAGWLVVALGVVHIAATPLVYPAYAGDLAFLYIFLATGIAVIFAGALMLLAAGGWSRGERWAWAVLLRTGIFLSLLGIGAVVTMADNPFAYLMLVFALVAALPVWVYRDQFAVEA